MKKNYFKKSLSLIMAIIMLMSCWVFVAPTDAGAIMDNSSKKADKYGTPYWTATDSNTRWMRWGSAADSSNDHLYIKVPKTIYMDVSETLQSAGYVITYSWHFGDSTDYRMGIASPVWGENSSYTGQDSTYFYTMTNAFNNFTADAAKHGSNVYGVNGYDNTNKYDMRVFDNYDGYKNMVFKNTGGTLFSGTIYYTGSPKGVYSGRYSTYGSNPKFGFGQKWGTSWKQHDNYTNMLKAKPTAASEQHSGWNEVFWDVEIYDKAPLKTAVDNADAAYTNNYSLYNTYVLNDALTTLKKTTDTYRSALSVREQTNAEITAKTTALNATVNGLQFQAKNADLKTKVTAAKALQNRAGYSTLYTAASRQALQAAIENATNSTLYTNPTVYTYNMSSATDAGAKAAAEQATINNLISGIDTAMNGLVRRYDVGYDNLFSLADWALNPVKDGKLSSNGTIEIDADNGTIKITHDGSSAGTDNNTSQQPTYYRAKVKGNTEYVLTWETAGSGRAQIHVFYTTGDQYTYNVNSNYNSGSHWFVSNGDLPYSSNMGKHEVAFTTLPETDGLVFRFGTSNSGDSVTYSNIRLVEKSVYDAYAKNYTTVREAFSVGDTKNLTYTPTRSGYVFDGWYKADGTKVTSVSGYSASDIVYAHWTQMYTVTFKNWNGDVLATTQVVPGGNATAPANDPTKPANQETEYEFAGWDKTYTNVTSDLVVTATFKEKAHNITKVYQTTASCTAAATYYKTCTCGVVWDELYTDGSALGHTFERENPSWKYTGDYTDDGHTVQCRAVGCSATTTMAHVYDDDATKTDKVATCSTQGEHYEICDCGKKNTVKTGYDSNNHEKIEVINKVEAACGKPGYSGDKWCSACKTTTETGSATPALEHVFTNYVDQGDATCDKAGTEVATCDREGCNETDSRSTGKKRDHSFTNYVDRKDATCDKEGTEIAVCDYADCNAEDSRSTGKKREHKFDGAVKNNKDGSHSYECSYDDCEVYGATVDCTYGEWTKDNATTHSHTCTACGYTPAAEAHDWTEWKNTTGSNTSASVEQKRSCKVCGREEVTDCEYKVTNRVVATCEAAEILTYECTICGHGYTTTGNGPTGHDYTGAAVTNGEGKHSFKCVNGCNTIGYEETKNMAVPCSEWTYENTEAGKHTATCKACGYEKTENCSGGQASCTAEAECQFCKTAYGEKAPHYYDGSVVAFNDGTHAYRCVYCEDEALYGVKELEGEAENCYGGEATCIELATCDICKEAYGTVAAHKFDGNTYFDGAVKAKDATCTTQAEYYTYCSVCNLTSQGEDAEATFKYGDLLPHTYTGDTWYEGAELATQAQCGVNETYYTYCSACNASSKDAAEEEATFEKADTALEHNYDGTIVDSNDDGTHFVTCSQSNDSWACGSKIKLNCVDSALSTGGEEATCTSQGYTRYQCALCNYSWNDNFTPVLGHNYTEKIIDNAHLKEAANCEHAKIYYYDCSRCDKNAKDAVEGEAYTGELTYFDGKVREHNWVSKVDPRYKATEATCENPEFYYASCSYADCAKSAKDVEGEATVRKFANGSRLGHDWVEPAEDVLDQYLANTPNCITEAKYYYTCSRADVCGKTTSQGETDATWTKAGSNLGHSLTHFEAVAPTCYVKGNYEYWYCELCKKYFKNEDATETFKGKDATEIAVRKHNTVEVPKKDPTCETNGYPAYVVCQYEDCAYSTYEANVPGYMATGHNFTSTSYYCDTVNNYHAKYCKNANCDGITIGETHYAKAFGMVVNGEQVKYSVEYDGLDYVIVGGEKCTFTYTTELIDGVHTHKNACVCGNNTTNTYADTFVETVAPTCTEDGYDLHVCPDANCGETWQMNIVKTEGHKPASTPTSNGDGTHSIVCTAEGCGEKLTEDACYGGNATCLDLAICEGCGGAYGTTTGHTFTADWEYQNDAVCGTTGTEKNTCDICDTEVTREKEGSPKQHNLIKDFVYDTEGWANAPEGFDTSIFYVATCSESGYGFRYCTECAYYVADVVRKDGSNHTWITETNAEGKEEIKYVLISGDCTVGFLYARTCEGCGAIETERRDGNHKWEVNAVIRSYCGNYDYIEFRCSECTKVKLFDDKYTYTDDNNVEHGYSIDGSFEGITKDGVLVNFVAENNLELGEHEWTEFKKVKEATCSSEGREERTCKRCSVTDKKPISVLDGAHNTANYGKPEYDHLIKVAAKKATCTIDGHNEYYTCRTCGTDIGKVVDVAPGHLDTNNDKKCDGCGKNLSNVVEKIDGCICHKDGGFSKFIYKILLTFWKLFKINKECVCGGTHY